MSQLVGELPSPLTDGSHRYRASIYADQLPDGRWEAWLEFDPVDHQAPTLTTDRETSQASRQALETWASGLETAYFEGAFARARVVTSHR